MMGLELGYKPSALAIELNNSKATAGKELRLSSSCIASLYIYQLWLRKYIYQLWLRNDKS